MMMLACSSTSTLVSGACSSLLPALGSAVFSRSSSFLSLTAPRPLREAAEPTTRHSSDDDVNNTNNNNTIAFAWTFAPLARELTRTAGGFEHRAQWPLGKNGSTLLDMHINSDGGSATTRSLRSPTMALSFASSFASRPYSSLPQQGADYTSAAAAPTVELESAEQPQAASSPAVLAAAWLPKAHPRLKGFSRKLVLRQVNRKIIARVARRFTIGIPVLGFYFVSKLLVKDYARVKAELSAGQYAVAALFSTAMVADVLDLAAQMTIITGMAHANLGVGLASAAALLVAADKASLATAALSFSCGLSGELLALKRAGELAAGSSSE